MKTRYLFPFKYKKVGWILFIIGLISGILFMILELDGPDWLTAKVFPLISSGFPDSNKSLSWDENNILDELISFFIIVGGILVSFSKAKQEDEYISKIRMESLIWATYVNYGVLLVCILFIFEMSFLNVMIYNMFTILIFFIVRFHFMLYKTKRQLSHEE